MAQKLLKTQKKKIAAKKDAAPQSKKIVLVGTYKERQLTWIKKNGVYNYPVKDGDEFDAGSVKVKKAIEAFKAGGEFGSLAGIGGFRLAMRNCGGGCVFSSEFDTYAQKTYKANFGEIPAGDITKQETHNLTDTQKGEIKWRLSA